MNGCYLCGGNSFSKRPGRVRDRRELDVLQCRSCGLVFLSSFDHITPDFYENSGMDGGSVNPDDWLRATARDDERRFRTLERDITNKTLLDFGCGNGGFLARAGRVAALAMGIEPDLSLGPHFHQKKLTVYPDPDEIDQTFDIITLFHVLEHLPDPVNILRRLAGMLRPEGSIIIEVPNATCFCSTSALWRFWPKKPGSKPITLNKCSVTRCPIIFTGWRRANPAEISGGVFWTAGNCMTLMKGNWV
jgi:SAM-dependent methyltransferase